MEKLIKVLEEIRAEAGSHTVGITQKTGFARIFDMADKALKSVKAQPKDSADKSPCNCPAKESCPEFDGGGGCVLING